MNRKLFCVVSVSVFSAMLVLSLGYVQAQTQTPGQITKFDASLNLVDSVITEDSNGNIGIGTTTSTAKLHVASSDVSGAAVVGNASGISGTGVVGNSTADPSLGVSIGVDGTGNTVGVRGVSPAANGIGVIGSALGTNGVGVSGFNNSAGGLAGRFDGAVQVRGPVQVTGTLRVDSLGAATATQLCWNSSTNLISACSSSLRYKEQVASFTLGLELMRHLRPVTFRWKTGGEPDLGLIAEEVNSVEPLLVTHNAKGEIEGVKYDRLAAVLINAVKEQQSQIQQQRQQIAELQAQLASIAGHLKRLDRQDLTAAVTAGPRSTP